MRDDSPAERRYWISKVEEMRKQMDQEELERRRKAATPPASPVKAMAGAGQPLPV
ncbi:MAG: hypothetical protein HYY78_05015 [Betaproteobacteria bacterium]|nr:hypothetical protein [Betaproteobacteria bacterium]